jgi:RimJ/RimL family protein N-acetyltransferase
MSDRTVTLQAFSLTDLEIVEPWFEDLQTRRFLGGPGWPARMLELDERRVAGEEFRGARQTGDCLSGGQGTCVPVGYVDCGTFERWTICEQRAGGVIVGDSIDVPAGSIAFVVDPDFRRQGLGRAMIAALISRPELGEVKLFGAGVEPENLASARCLRAAGFRLQAKEPDFEGMLYYLAGPTLARKRTAV